MSERPKDWEILKALDEGREVTGWLGSKGDGAKVTLHHVEQAILVTPTYHNGVPMTPRNLDNVVDIKIAPPTSYTLEEAAAALVRGERVLCDIRIDGGLPAETEVFGVRRAPGGFGLVTVFDYSGVWHLEDEVSNIRPAPPEPSIEELMRAHDPVGNPTVELSLASGLEPFAKRIPATRFLKNFCGFQALFFEAGDSSGRFYNYSFLSDGVSRYNSELLLVPITDEGRAHLAEWAKGQQS